jgi:hypothetical protein
MSVRRSKPDYPFLTAEPGPELVERELRNEFLVEEVHGNNNVNAISRKRLGLNWLFEYAKSIQEIIAKSSIRRELSTPNAGEYVTVREIHGYPVGSPPWHAENILFWVIPLIQAFKYNETTLSPKDMDTILDAGIRLGAAIKEFQIARQFSDPLVSGLKRRDSLKRSSTDANAKRQAQAAENHKKWKAAAAEIWSRNPRLTTIVCARTVISRLSLNARLKTVADQIRYLKPKKVGEAG